MNKEGGLCDEALILPVNPESIAITESVKSQVLSVIGGVDRSVLGSMDLKSIEVKSFFPLFGSSYWKTYKDSGQEGQWKSNPKFFIDQLSNILKGKRPVRINVFDDRPEANTTSMDFSMDCYLTKFTYGEKGGSQDVSYTLGFQERRDVSGFWKPVSEGGQVTLETRPALVPSPKVYTVKSGDSLWRIAQNLLGDGDLWPQIYEANKDIIGPDPNLIQPGQRLVLADV